MRKKTKMLLPAIMLSACMISAAGCSDPALGNDSLLRPPRATGDKAAIQEIIASEAGGSYTLKYPQKGENRSAITLRNENTDKEYAIALYATENDTKLNVSIISFDKQKEWKCLGTFTHNYSGVDRVLFYDVNGDKNEEVVIGWTSFNSTQKSLSAYSMSPEEAYEMQIDETYDEMVITNLNGDTTDDMILLSLSTPEKPSSATMLSYSVADGKPVGSYSLELDPEVVAFSNIVIGDAAINTDTPENEEKDTATGARTENSKTENSSVAENSRQVSSVPEPSGAVSEPSAAVPESSAAVPEPSGAVPGAVEPETESSEEIPEPSEPSDETPEESSETSKIRIESSEVRVENSVPSEDETSGQESSLSEASVPEVQEDPENEKLIISKRGIVLDCKRKDNTYCTQMIYFDHFKEEIVDPLKRRSDSNPTIRTDAVFSCDINDDDIIDIPVVSQMNASADESGANVCNLTTWYNYDAQVRKPVPVCSTVMNLKDGYYFLMPERWTDAVTARRDPETRELTFYLWNAKTSSTGDKLLTISRYNEQQWAEQEHDDLIMLDIRQENSKIVYAAKIFVTSAEDKLNITEDELEKLVYKI